MQPLDNSSQFIITTLLSSLSLIVAITALTLQWLSLRQQSLQPKIIFEVTEDKLLLLPGQDINDPDMNSKLKMTFDQNPIPNMRRIIIRAWNSGIPLQEGDFKTPLTFSFEQTARILHTSIKTAPTDFDAGLDLPGQNQIALKPPLFNRREVIELKVLLSHSDNVISGLTRIANATAGKELSHSYKTALLRILRSMGKYFAISVLIFICLFVATQIPSRARGIIESSTLYLLFITGLSSIWLILLWQASIARLKANRLISGRPTIIFFISLLVLFTSLLYCLFLALVTVFSHGG